MPCPATGDGKLGSPDCLLHRHRAPVTEAFDVSQLASREPGNSRRACVPGVCHGCGSCCAKL